MKVLVTGATGRLGSLVCKELSRLGHDVLGTDQRFAADLGVPLTLADLRVAHAVYPLLEGREAVVHLGNIPNLSLGPSPQQPGYHQYFPAQTIILEGYTVERTLSELFPHVPLRVPAGQIRSLVDVSALQRDLGFSLAPPLTVRLEQR
jgi:NAD(P)-dependent dehydrogenase (short-subunit alcohol dehydrogenase family)